MRRPICSHRSGMYSATPGAAEAGPPRRSHRRRAVARTTARPHQQEDSRSRTADEPMKRKEYEKELRKLQAELCGLQEWVKAKGLRVIVVFEGRDAAGKGGTIKAITERVSPRVFRVVALPAPSDREKIADVHAALHAALPGGRRDRDLRPQLVQPRRRRERAWASARRSSTGASSTSAPSSSSTSSTTASCSSSTGWRSSEEEQKRRFEARIDDPLRQWKLSPMDLGSRSRWYEYSRARDLMLEATDTKHAPWYIVPLGRQAARPPQLHPPPARA